MTAVEWLDEQIQERVIAQDVVARKMIIEISMEDYMDIKRQAKEMEKQMIIDAANQNQFGDIDGMGICDSITKGQQYYNETYGSKGSDEITNCDIQTEISDEEIEKEARKLANIEHNRPLDLEERYYKDYQQYDGIVIGMKWYREQLNKK